MHRFTSHALTHTSSSPNLSDLQRDMHVCVRMYALQSREYFLSQSKTQFQLIHPTTWKIGHHVTVSYVSWHSRGNWITGCVLRHPVLHTQSVDHSWWTWSAAASLIIPGTRLSEWRSCQVCHWHVPAYRMWLLVAVTCALCSAIHKKMLPNLVRFLWDLWWWLHFQFWGQCTGPVGIQHACVLSVLQTNTVSNRIFQPFNTCSSLTALGIRLAKTKF